MVKCQSFNGLKRIKIYEKIIYQQKIKIHTNMKPQLIIELEQELNCVFETIEENLYENRKKDKIAEYSVDSQGNITEIKIQEFELNTIPKTLIQCKDLINLDLSYNQIEDISPLKELKNIQKLKLSGNKICNISPLKKLENILSLNLSHNKIVNFKDVNHWVDNFRFISNWIGNPIDIETLYPNINLTTNVCFLDDVIINIFLILNPLKPILNQKKIEIYYARNNQEVLVLFEKAQTIHLLYTDILRPGGNNTDLYKYMNINKYNPIKVLLTAYPDPIDVNQISELEYIDYLKKPIIPEMFKTKFLTFLDLALVIEYDAKINNESFYNTYKNYHLNLMKKINGNNNMV